MLSGLIGAVMRRYLTLDARAILRNAKAAIEAERAEAPVAMESQ